jgi:hypothetical protein
MPDIVELILADHMRIRELLGGLGDMAGDGEPGDDRLAKEWEVLAGLLEVHLDAAEEIAYPALFSGPAHGARPMAQVVADHADVREAMDEARLHPAGSPLWWLAIRAARAAAISHIDAVESGPLARFRWETSPREREILGRQWVGFVTARASDGYVAADG